MATKLRTKITGSARKTVIATALALSVASLSAKDLIELQATSRAGPAFTSPTTRNLSVGGDSIPDLVDNVISKEGEFEAFENDRFIVANLDVLGVHNVLVFDIIDNTSSGGGYSATLRSDLTDLNQSFSGSSRDDVQDQIEDYLKENGSDEVAKILKALNRRSPLGVNAGNPNSTSSLIAQDIFQEYGFPDSQSNAQKEAGGHDGGFGIGIIGDAGLIEANGYEARSYTLPLAFRIFSSKRWAVDFKIPLNYTQIEGADIYRIGTALAVPIVIIRGTPEKPSPWFWQVTPSAGSMATVSIDLVNGGILNNASLSSALGYDLGERFKNITIAMGNQITFIESMEVGAQGYSFDPDVSAQILKNGLRVSVPFGQSWVWDIYGIDTRFLGDSSYADGYETVGTALGFKPNVNGGYFKVGTYANFAEDYSSVNFQLGAGWNF